MSRKSKVGVTSASSSSAGSTPPRTPILVEEARKPEAPWKNDDRFISPLKSIAFNLRFNQIFGVLPAAISKDFMVLRFKPLYLLSTVAVKLFFLSTILSLLHVWSTAQGGDLEALFQRIFEDSGFTKTDKFAIVSHFSFLILSAMILFFNNLGLCKQLTELNHVLKALTSSSHVDLPSAKPLLCYRISVCVVCTLASLLYFLGVHSLSRNPEVNIQDYLVVSLLVVAFYIENQNHMFSELLFMRYSSILLHQAKFLRQHVRESHLPAGRRNCCHERARIVYQMFSAINKAFGDDLLVTILILVISVTLGMYLTLIFTVFIATEEESGRTGGNHGGFFIAAYVLYSIIPAVRFHVIVQTSENVKNSLGGIKEELQNIEHEIKGNRSDVDKDDSSTKVELSNIQRVVKKYAGCQGFSAAGYFDVNRGLISSVVGSLVTYLIVLLQFRAGEYSPSAKKA